jgi:hypothetical protein
MSPHTNLCTCMSCIPTRRLSQSQNRRIRRPVPIRFRRSLTWCFRIAASPQYQRR